MINRVLIRIKTIQLLYSYLLVQKPFSLESQPSQPTKEKRFAYSLYLDTIFLFYKLANRIKGKNKTLPLTKTRFILKIEEDDRFKSVKTKYSDGSYSFSTIENELSENVKNSLIFRELEKEDITSNDKVWEDIFNAVIFPNPGYQEIVKSLPGYSLTGLERMKSLLEETFRNFYSTRDNINDALNTLSRSMDEARELYMRLLALPVDITELMKGKLEQHRHKILATPEDLNPNLKFIDNQLPQLIEEHEDFKDYIEKKKISWIAEDPELIERLLNLITESEIYKSYMEDTKRNVGEDIELWKELFRQVILPSEDFLDYMENKSVFWNDDLEIVSTFLYKTFRQFENPETRPGAILPMYKDDEDARFGFELFKFVVNNKELYKSHIDKAIVTDKWETERLAFMDVVITMTALAEILNYPKIPLQVSINEYIEIAKSYSTSKSGSFVHGLLATIISKMQESGELQKGLHS